MRDLHHALHLGSGRLVHGLVHGHDQSLAYDPRHHLHLRHRSQELRSSHLQVQACEQVAQRPCVRVFLFQTAQQ
jgi:hypothetical protein